MEERRNSRSRTFKGKYTDNSGKEHHFTVKIFGRLIALGLALVLVKGSYTAIIGTSKKDDSKKDNNLEDAVLDQNLEQINEILKENPNMLREVSTSIHTVEFGETLGKIAENNGNTVKRIMELNDIKDNTQIIFAGEDLRVETIKPLSEIDAEIKMLESYFYDYVFNSSVAEMAKSSAPDDKQANFYKSIIYGNPKSESEPDMNSIYGMYIQAYLNFHDENKEHTEESKQAYIYTLTSLAKEVDEKINLDGMNNVLINYDLYKVYCINRSTEYTEVQEKNHTIYG